MTDLSSILLRTSPNFKEKIKKNKTEKKIKAVEIQIPEAEEIITEQTVEKKEILFNSPTFVYSFIFAKQQPIVMYRTIFNQIIIYK